MKINKKTPGGATLLGLVGAAVVLDLAWGWVMTQTPSGVQLAQYVSWHFIFAAGFLTLLQAAKPSLAKVLPETVPAPREAFQGDAMTPIHMAVVAFVVFILEIGVGQIGSNLTIQALLSGGVKWISAVGIGVPTFFALAGAGIAAASGGALLFLVGVALIVSQCFYQHLINEVPDEHFTAKIAKSYRWLALCATPCLLLASLLGARPTSSTLLMALGTGALVVVWEVLNKALTKAAWAQAFGENGSSLIAGIAGIFSLPGLGFAVATLGLYLHYRQELAQWLSSKAPWLNTRVVRLPRRRRR